MSPQPANDPQDARLARDRQRLQDLIGFREHAAALFQTKVQPDDVRLAAGFLIDAFAPSPVLPTVSFDFGKMTDESVAEWAPRCWVNGLAHLCETDASLRKVVTTQRSWIPNNGAARQFYLGKLRSAWLFFLWVHLRLEADARNGDHCVIRIVVLEDVILLEDLRAQKDGQPGGWGLIEKCLVGLRNVARGFRISRIKAVATNERVYGALLRRGFRDQPPEVQLERHVTKYARPVELALD